MLHYIFTFFFSLQDNLLGCWIYSEPKLIHVIRLQQVLIGWLSYLSNVFALLTLFACGV